MRARCGPVSMAVIACVLLLAGCGDTNRNVTSTTPGSEPLTVPTPELRNGDGTAAAADPDSQLRQVPSVQTSLVHTGGNRYVLTVANASDIGSIDAFKWVVPEGVRVTNIASATGGSCSVVSTASPAGHSVDAISCAVHLHPPSCTCLGDGGKVAVRFEAVLAKSLTGHGLAGATQVTALTPVLKPVPSALPTDAQCKDASTC